MAQVTISEETYQALVEVAREQGVTPAEVIDAAVVALGERRAHPDRALTEEEFAAALGMTAEDIVRADAEARRLYPEAFGIDPAQP